MRKLALFLSMILFVGLQAMSAQTKAISGKVVDDLGEAIPGVSIIVKGTTIGTISRPDGTYNLNVPEDATAILFTFVGMEMQEVAYTGQTTINVTMKPDAISVDEVVVTALGISKEKKALGYASYSVSGDEVAESNSVNPMNALQGKVAGVQITSGANPGATQNVIIRGASSFGSNQPLYVVDGVPLVNNQNANDDRLNSYVDFGSGLNAVNPDDIADISVLKGAAATVLYGSRAANGAILITTKSGKNTDGKMKFKYSGSIGISEISRVPEMQKSFGQGWSGMHALDENGNWGPRYDGQMRPWGNVVDNSQQVAPFSYIEDRINDFFEYGLNYKNSISAYGGNANTDYFLSFTQNSVDGIYPDDVDSYDRYTISTKASHKTEKLKVSTSINFSTEKTNAVPMGQGSSAYRSLFEIANNISIVDLKDYKNKFNSLDNYFTPYGLNPYWALNENGATQKKYKFFGKAQLDYNLLDNLVFTYRFGGDFESSTGEQWTAKVAFTEDSFNDGSSSATSGSYSIIERKRYETNHDFYLNYNTQLTSDLGMNVLVGANLNERNYSELTGAISSIDVDGFYRLSNSLSDAIAAQDNSKKRMGGIYASVDFDYKNFLYLNVIARNDWSSTLPSDNNSFFYPGVTGSFVFSELLNKTGNSPAFLNFGKLRMSYALAGNDAPMYGIYSRYFSGEMYLPGYPDVDDLTMPLGGVNSYEVGNTLGSPDLKPEISKEFEVGLELSMFKNRVGLDLSYYDRYTDGLIDYLPIDPTSGYTSQLKNLCDVTNQGIDIALNLTPLKIGDFKWDLTYTFSKNWNEVVNSPVDEVNLGGFGGAGIYAVEGKELGIFKTSVAKKVQLDSNYNIVASGGQDYYVVDGNGNVQPSTEEEYTNKSINEDFAMGLQTTFSWKGLSLGATFDYHKGGYLYSATKNYMHWVGSAIESTYNDRNPFIVPGSVVLNADGSYSENMNPVTSNTFHNFYNDYGAFESAEYAIIDRSFLKLREVRLSYTLPAKITEGIGITDVKLSAIAGNILLWTPSDNPYVDPEVTTFGNDVEARFGEFMSNPTSRTYSFTLTLGF